MSKEIADGANQANANLAQLRLVQGTITTQAVDAIVTLYPQSLEPKDALNLHILEQAGDQLDPYIRAHVLMPKAPDVHAVPGFELPCSYVFVGLCPVWRTEFDRADKSLLDVCRAAIGLAKGMEDVRSLAFPLLVGGKYGYPKKRAIRLITQAILEGLDEQLDEIRIVCEDDADLDLFRERLEATD
jgi:O-acetyl-ADP-ribose deacetylase (regulator of RNase III)